MVPGLSFYLFYDQTAVLKIERRPQTGTRKKNQHQKRLDLKTENPIKRSALQPVYTLLSFFSLPSYCGDFIWMQSQCGCTSPWAEYNAAQQINSVLSSGEDKVKQLWLVFSLSSAVCGSESKTESDSSSLHLHYISILTLDFTFPASIFKFCVFKLWWFSFSPTD